MAGAALATEENLVSRTNFQASWPVECRSQPRWVCCDSLSVGTPKMEPPGDGREDGIMAGFVKEVTSEPSHLLVLRGRTILSDRKETSDSWSLLNKEMEL